MTDLTLTDQLEALLQAERIALLDGDLDRIAELMDEKQELIDGIDQSGIPGEELVPLRDGLRRNQELFDQALAGIRNVATRLGDLQRLRRSMHTYDSSGNRTTIEAPQENKLERRA